MKKKILYISYDGMLEPLGQSQVLSYQERLAEKFEIHILSFEKSFDEPSKNQIMRRFNDAGMYWHPLKYHKSPAILSTVADITYGLLKSFFIVRSYKIDIIHARSYVPAVIALSLKKVFGIQFIFDMRGFWVDERVDGNLWKKNSYIYKISKWFESKFLLNADHIISLTYAAVREIKKFPYLTGRSLSISVIPTCTDLSQFKLKEAKINDPEKNFVLGYVGSVGTWYNFDAVIEAFKLLIIKEPTAKLLVVNQNEHELISSMIKKAGISNEFFKLIKATHSEVPQLMQTMTAGIFFIEPLFSKRASAPTKLGEFLGCGIPCISNRGVGDMTNILEGENVGVAVSDFENQSLNSAIFQLIDISKDPDISLRCSKVAKKYFSLEKGVADLQKIYIQLKAS
jgi:glycosyltransferase involved in cell wall biosynthesis